MQKNTQLITVAAVIAAAVGFSWVNRVRAVGNMIFLPGQILSFGYIGSLPTVQFSVFVQNTSGTPVTLNSLAANVFTSGQLIGNLSQFEPILIAPNAQTQITLTATLRPITLVTELTQLFLNKLYQRNILIEGYANANGLQFPVKLNLTLGA